MVPTANIRNGSSHGAQFGSINFLPGEARSEQWNEAVFWSLARFERHVGEVAENVLHIVIQIER